MLRVMFHTLLCLSLITLAKEENVEREEMKDRNRNTKIMENHDTHREMNGKCIDYMAIIFHHPFPKCMIYSDLPNDSN
jgi:hypothetical protein